jgi:hypothetical protein
MGQGITFGNFRVEFVANRCRVRISHLDAVLKGTSHDRLPELDRCEDRTASLT